MEILIDVGGNPGIDCRGFCRYCYFKKVKSVEAFGCRHCLPFKKGCDFCTRGVREAYSGFRPMRQVLEETMAKLSTARRTISSTETGFDENGDRGENDRDERHRDAGKDAFVITGGGDISCYPELLSLISFLSQLETPIKIGYTSGKGFRGDEAAFLLENNVVEVNYTLFASDPALRRAYMNDPEPEKSLEVFERLCAGCDVYAAVVLIPGVNDGAVLEQTLDYAERAGAKSVLLMRFANGFENGLILKNAPIIDGVVPHTISEFTQIVKEAAAAHPALRISGTPLEDPAIGSPYAVRNEPDRLAALPKITKEATVITGAASFERLSAVFASLSPYVNVVRANKDIACLITIEDLLALDLTDVKETVFIPGRAFVHDPEAKEALRRDGVDRIVRRGPDTLTVDGEISAGMTKEEVLDLESAAFTELIEHINAVGTVPRQ